MSYTNFKHTTNCTHGFLHANGWSVAYISPPLVAHLTQTLIILGGRVFYVMREMN